MGIFAHQVVESLSDVTPLAYLILGLMKQHYTYSIAVYWMTAIGLVAEVWIGYSLLFESLPTWSFVLHLGCFLLLLVPIYFFPRAYSLDQAGVTVHCLGCSKTFPWSHYAPSPISRETLPRGIRVCGSGGYFGFLGFFWLPKQGMALLLVANEKSPLLQLKNRQTGRTYIINASLEGAPPSEA